MASLRTTHRVQVARLPRQSLAVAVGLIALATLGGTGRAVAATHQVALFRGFASSPPAGMDFLHAALSSIPDFEGQVFAWTEQQAALTWIEQQAERSTLVLIGHSFGANSALQLANNLLQPNGIDVDLTVQLDSVENFYTGWNDVLPANVAVGWNYYQNSTGFFEPQGEDQVQGATNINVEVLLSDLTITHTSIDNDARVHDLIYQNILDNLNLPPVENADFDASDSVDGHDFLIWQRGAGTLGTGTQPTGDADGDSDINQRDLLIWQQQWGDFAAPLATVHTLPEPATWVGLLLAGGGLTFRRLATRGRL